MVQLGYGPANLDRGDLRADEFLGDGRYAASLYTLNVHFRQRKLEGPFTTQPFF